MVLLLLAVSVFGSTRVIQVPIKSKKDIHRLRRFPIYRLEDNSLQLLVTPQDLTKLKNLGYHYHVLIDDYEGYLSWLKRRGKYHSYHELDSILNYYAKEYPNISRLETLGYSVQGRCIFSMKISDNPGQDEVEPEMRLIGNMHGDEFIGCEIPLYFLTYLLDNHNSPQVKGLIDSIEFFIIPMLNPDGHELNQRYNANGVDLNRDCGYFWEGWGNSPSPFSQPESRVYLRHNYEHNNTTIEYNYHSVQQYVNYVWDYHPHDPPDSAYIVQLSQIYASQAGLQVINGYEWYQVCGSLQDASFGGIGSLAWTIETLQPSNPAQIDQICYENRDALLSVAQRVKWGIYGLVTDSISGRPIWAKVRIVEPVRWHCYTDTVNGDYHKMLPAGTYDIEFWAPGYQPMRRSNIQVPPQGAVRVDGKLLPDSTKYYGFQVVAVKYARHTEDSINTQPYDALGPTDNRFFSLGRSGFIIIDMHRPIRNGPGDDLTVYEGDDGLTEGYTVYVSDSWSGPWKNLGSGSGIQGFDLGSVTDARYVRIVDDGSSTSGPFAGFDLDAIEARYVVPGVCEEREPISGFEIGPNPGPWVWLNYTLSRSSGVEITLYDPSGRSIFKRCFHQAPGHYRLRIDHSDLPSGIYFLSFQTPEVKRIEKIILIR
ncbi:MAG TPA: T9SS type A sorting domain-containing protein [bacterium (Candidatus Stahlbacteria)]|nr:T9SS type A sorting domain-containing protein [Candidatus Stahlbacteria bacterium]